MRANRLLHAVEVVRHRHARLKARKRTAVERGLQMGALALSAISVTVATFALAALPFYFYLAAGLPPVERLPELMDPISGELLQPTRLYDSAGETMILALVPDGIERQFISATEMPWLVKAYISSNQPNFWLGNNFDWGKFISPPSTIAGHLAARLLLPSQPEGWLKNIRTQFLAADAMTKYGPEQILTWALNSTDFGHWAFGAESAAQLYFGKSATEMSLAESALLAAVAQAPALNPFDVPELAVSFQRLVLTAMREQGVITEAEFTAAVAQPLVFADAKDPVSLASDFTDLAVAQLEAELGHQRAVNGGLEATTTLNYALQGEVTELFKEFNQTDLVVLDPANNRLLAALGNSKGRHNSGSLLRPLTYLSAFAQGWTPSSLVWDVNNKPLATSHGPVTLRQALAKNYSNVASLLFKDIDGARNISELMQILGLDISFVTEEGSEISTLEGAQIYSVVSQNGLIADSPSTSNTLLFAADPNGDIELNLIHAEWQSMVSPELAYLVTDILSDHTFWQSPIIFNRPAAVFSGADQHWEIIYSPQRVIALWNEEKTAPTLLSSVFEVAHRGLAVKGWEVPAGLSSVVVCVPSGQLPDDDCPETRREWFLRGTEPIETDSLYQRLAINILNGKLATVFTPEEFVQERLFLAVPPEAEAWARAAGIPLPPHDYDPIPALSSDGSGPAIDFPEPFTEISGKIEIVGNLGTDTVGFDVQVGQGLRPQEWQKLAEGRVVPRDGILTEWDTTTLNGVWAIQIQVWDAEGRITRAYTLVTIRAAK